MSVLLPYTRMLLLINMSLPLVNRRALTCSLLQGASNVDTGSSVRMFRHAAPFRQNSCECQLLHPNLVMPSLGCHQLLWYTLMYLLGSCVYSVRLTHVLCLRSVSDWWHKPPTLYIASIEASTLFCCTEINLTCKVLSCLNREFSLLIALTLYSHPVLDCLDMPLQIMVAIAEKKRRPTIPPESEVPGGTFSGLPAYLDLMQACWHADPQERPAFESCIITLRSLLEEAMTVK